MMWNLRCLRKLNDKGYSLLELVVTIAIVSAVGAGISALMLSGTRLFGMQSASVRLQTKGQLLSSQLRAYFTEATDIHFESIEDETHPVLDQFHGMEACVVYGVKDGVNCILFDAESEKLFYGEGIALTEGEDAYPLDVTQEEIVMKFPLLAQGVTRFAISFPGTDEGDVSGRMETDVCLTDHDATYEFQIVTAIRNHAPADKEPLR